MIIKTGKVTEKVKSTVCNFINKRGDKKTVRSRVEESAVVTELSMLVEPKTITNTFILRLNGSKLN